MATMPTARGNLIVRDLGAETVLYDVKTGAAHSLSPAAAAVWAFCDGRSDVAQVATRTGLSAADVGAATSELAGAGLVSGPLGRRQVLTRGALVGGAVVAAPLVSSIVAPVAAAAASTGGGGTGMRTATYSWNEGQANGSLTGTYNDNSTATTPNNVHIFHGEFSNEQLTLTLSNVPKNGTGTFTFDFYGIQSLDGNATNDGTYSSGVGDYFTFGVGGSSVSTNFSLYGGSYNQSYPQTFTPPSTPNGNNPPGTGATALNSLGYSFGGAQYNDGVWSFTSGVGILPALTTDGSGTLVLSWEGFNLQGLGDEGWGINNIFVTITGT